jgi:hypothetical protein
MGMNMKKLALLLVLVPSWLLAQNTLPFDPSEMPSGADMQGMMLQMQEMQVCMASIDQAELERFQQQAQAMSDEIDALCNSGDGEEALTKALAFSQQMRDEPVMQQLMDCASGANNILSQWMPTFSTPEIEASVAAGDYDICSE